MNDDTKPPWAIENTIGATAFSPNKKRMFIYPNKDRYKFHELKKLDKLTSPGQN